MKKYFFIIFFSISLFTLSSCKSVGGYYIRHGSGLINDTLHYRLTIPNNSNINLLNIK